jgi:hypothetical protein
MFGVAGVASVSSSSSSSREFFSSNKAAFSRKPFSIKIGIGDIILSSVGIFFKY